MADGGIGDCGTSNADPGNCHMLDIVRPAPGTTATRSYKYRIEARVWDGASCNSNYSDLSYQEGCFWLNWVTP